MYARVRKTFRSGVTLPLEYRRRQLAQLARCIQENATAFENAVYADIGKPRIETNQGELGAVVFVSLYAIEHLEEWASPKKPAVPPPVRDEWDSTVYRVPKGVALILA